MLPLVTVKISQTSRKIFKGHQRDMIAVMDVKLPMQSVPITTNVVILNPAYDEVYLYNIM
jgi:hypothetical protein